MNRQADLFGDYGLYGGQPPAQRHSSTSSEAAASIKQHIGPLHARIIGWLKLHPSGGSDERIAEGLNMGQNTFRPRRRELQLMGRVVDSGRTELTQSGRNAVIWRLT